VKDEVDRKLQLTGRRPQMFDSLNDKIRQSEDTSEAPVMRWLRYAGIFMVSLLAFGALYSGILFLE
jgi:hypothetical protein